MRHDYKQLIATHLALMSNVKDIASDILRMVRNSYNGDFTSLDKLQIINAKEYNILNSFFKASAVILKLIPVEQKLSNNTGLFEQFNEKITQQEQQILNAFYDSYQNTRKKE